MLSVTTTEGGTMRRRRRAYAVMAAVGAFAHACGSAIHWNRDAVQRDFSVLGVLLCLWMVYLALRRGSSLRWVDMLALLIGLMWLTVDASQDLLASRSLSTYVLLDVAIVGVMTFNAFTVGTAIMVMVPLYTLVAALYLSTNGQETPMVIVIGLLIALVGFMSSFSRQLGVEQARAEWLHQLAYQDPLTGVSSRRVAEDELAKLMERGTDTQHVIPQETALVMFDVDHFKRVNDEAGHLEGDRTLQRVAQTLRAGVRADDLVCRWGGEEFLVILYEIDPLQIRGRVEEIRQKVAAMDGPIKVTLSAGGALLSEGRDARAVLGLADQRLYAAKSSGRDQSVWGSAPTRPPTLFRPEDQLPQRL